MEAGALMERDVTRLEAALAALTSEYRQGHSHLETAMSELKAIVREHPGACPYRERIAMITENTKDIDAVKSDVADIKRCVHDIELAVARSSAVGGAAGGGVVTVVVGIVYGLGKAAGWW